MNEGSILKGRTTLVEQAARDSTARVGDKGWLRDEGDPLSAAKGICIGIAISTALYGLVILAAVAAGLL